MNNNIKRVTYKLIKNELPSNILLTLVVLFISTIFFHNSWLDNNYVKYFDVIEKYFTYANILLGKLLMALIPISLMLLIIEYSNKPVVRTFHNMIFKSFTHGEVITSLIVVCCAYEKICIVSLTMEAVYRIEMLEYLSGFCLLISSPLIITAISCSLKVIHGVLKENNYKIKVNNL